MGSHLRCKHREDIVTRSASFPQFYQKLLYQDEVPNRRSSGPGLLGGNHILLSGSGNLTTMELLHDCLIVFPRASKHNGMEQWHNGGAQRVLLQQLDDLVIPAALAAVHPAQLIPIPEDFRGNAHRR
ncbi:hypothetical protein Q5P01_002201 [Channa striata]|uniref:Uncharacterized protein n=1 Tax=Channa striata TaxID=64152 RepID=A0AA88T5Y4_CHASR|nr:hypothetical protein Q5P01_002201 [Channa striata]